MDLDNQYFGVYFPEPQVSVGSRYFFFKSLENTELGGAVSGVLSSHLNKIQPDNDEGLQIVGGAMAFLKAMIENEQANEKAYYRMNIIDNDKLPQAMRDECSSLFDQNVLDYINFINLINKYYDGVDNYKNNLTYESTRLHKLQTLYKKFAQHYTQNSDGTYTVKMKNKDTGVFENKNVSFYQAFRDFLITGAKSENGWISKADSQFGFNTKTIANTVQNQFQSIYNQIWNNTDFRAGVEQAVLNQGLQGYEQYLTAKFAQDFIHEAQGSLAKCFEGSEFKVTLNKTEIRGLIDQFVKKLDSQPGNTTAEKIESEIISSVKDEAQSLLSAEYQIQNSSDRILKNVKNNIEVSVNRSGHGIDNLSQDIINLCQEILAKKKKKTSVSSQKIWDAKTLYQALDEAFPEQEIKIKSKKYDTNKLVGVINDLIKGQKLVKVSIAAKDNIISEGMSRSGLQKASTLLGRIKNIILTFGTQKADVSGIELGMVKFDQPNINWKNITEKVMENYLTSLEIGNIDINSKNIQFNEKNFRKENGFGDREFSIEAETMRRIALKEKEIEEVTADLKKKGVKADEIQEVLKHLKDTVQIGSTVKSYNKLDNNEGFHGGSLGGSVETQLANLCKMLSYGSVVFLPEDIDWLTLAVYNAGSGLMGSALKKPIEDILSTVAVMLMFDDAGQQAIYLNEQIKSRYSEHNGSQFLHLYYLNGTYYPSSFILQLTYNGLLKAYQELEQEQLKGTEAFNGVSNGSRANIINPVSEANEIGTLVDGEKVTTKQEQWQATFNANKGSVKIQVTFLAGVLDIIDILNNSLQL